MREWTRQAETKDVAVLLFPRFSNLCLANAVEPLRAANELLGRQAYRWSFVTLDGQGVSSSSGLPVVPNSALRDHEGGDTLFVISSYGMRDWATNATDRALQAAARRFDLIVGMDTGAWLMAHAGLLDDTVATIHWAELTAFAERFDKTDAVSERVVQVGNRMTCGGALAAFDAVLDLIRRDHGEAIGLEVAAFFLHRSTEPPKDRVFRHRASPLVEQCLGIMSEHVEAPLAIADIARRIGVSQRTLLRTFHDELGTSPRTAYLWIRLAAVRRYAQQSSYSIAEIAVRCGYANAAAMTRAFVQRYGHAPSSLRKRAD